MTCTAVVLVGHSWREQARRSVVGELPSGLPHLALPHLDPAILRELAPGALAIVLIGYAEALGGTLLHGSAGGRSDPRSSWSHTMRT